MIFFEELERLYHRVKMGESGLQKHKIDFFMRQDRIDGDNILILVSLALIPNHGAAHGKDCADDDDNTQEENCVVLGDEALTCDTLERCEIGELHGLPASVTQEEEMRDDEEWHEEEEPEEHRMLESYCHHSASLMP